MKQIIKLKESDLHRIINESVKTVLNEDAFDVPYIIDDVIKKAYKLRHEIHKAYNGCDFPGSIRKNGMAVSSMYGGASGKLGQLLYDSYRLINNLIVNLKQASKEFEDEIDNEPYENPEDYI